MLWLTTFSLRGNLSFSGAITVWTDTSGLTIVSNIWSWQYSLGHDKYREVHWEYLAIARGSVTPSEGTHPGSARAARKGTIIERTVDWEHGEDAVTHYKVVKKQMGTALSLFVSETYCTHQIRIHEISRLSTDWDYLYNPDMEYMTRQALHSHHMEFTHPITGEHMSFTAPLPEDMAGYAGIIQEFIRNISSTHFDDFHNL